MNSRRFARVRQRPRHKPGEMNKLEERYAAILAARQAAGEIDAYWFERFTFKLADDTRYTPDFVVQMPDGTLEAHEVKARANKPARKVNGVKVRPLGTRPLVGMTRGSRSRCLPRCSRSGAWWRSVAARVIHGRLRK